jgi:hypothetical protein
MESIEIIAYSMGAVCLAYVLFVIWISTRKEKPTEVQER